MDRRYRGWWIGAARDADRRRSAEPCSAECPTTRWNAGRVEHFDLPGRMRRCARRSWIGATGNGGSAMLGWADRRGSAEPCSAECPTARWNAGRVGTPGALNISTFPVEPAAALADHGSALPGMVDRRCWDGPIVAVAPSRARRNARPRAGMPGALNISTFTVECAAALADHGSALPGMVESARPEMPIVAVAPSRARRNARPRDGMPGALNISTFTVECAAALADHGSALPVHAQPNASNTFRIR